MIDPHLQESQKSTGMFLSSICFLLLFPLESTGIHLLRWDLYFHHNSLLFHHCSIFFPYFYHMFTIFSHILPVFLPYVFFGRTSSSRSGRSAPRAVRAASAAGRGSWRMCRPERSGRPTTTAFCQREKPWIWVNYNELTTSSLEIMVNKRNHPKMALFQVRELL